MHFTDRNYLAQYDKKYNANHIGDPTFKDGLHLLASVKRTSFEGQNISILFGETPLSMREETISRGGSINISDRIPQFITDRKFDNEYIFGKNVSDDIDVLEYFSGQMILTSAYSTTIDMTILISAVQNLRNSGYIPIKFDDFPIAVDRAEIAEATGEYPLPYLCVDSTEMRDFEPISKYKKEYDRQREYVRTLLLNACGYVNGLAFLNMILDRKQRLIPNESVSRKLDQIEIDVIKFTNELRPKESDGDHPAGRREYVYRLAKYIKDEHFPDLNMEGLETVKM